jgi:hypothetical protein
VEQGEKLLPVTVSVSCPDPAVTPVGAMAVVVGAGRFAAGPVTEKFMELERAEPLETVMGTVAGFSVSV